METSDIHHLSTIAERYDVFLFDIFGVLHNGENLITDTIDAIDNLTAIGKKLFFLTNAPHRSNYIISQLKAYGFNDSHFYGILTAGDQTHYYLKTRPPPCHTRLGKTCYFIGNQSMIDILPEEEYEITKDVGSADFILAAGPESPQNSLQQYRDTLKKAAKHSLPMLCSNPDLSVHRKGRLEIRAGQLAVLYQNFGGKVFYHGKPFAQTYEMVFKMLKGIKKERMLFIGDSVLTDVAGANRANIDCLLTVSSTTLHEIGHLGKYVDFRQFCRLIEKLNNALYLPKYFSNPLKW